MTLFRYKAVTPAGETLDGQIEVASDDEVIGSCRTRATFRSKCARPMAPIGQPVRVVVQAQDPEPKRRSLQFTQQLATLLGAGQPLDRALQILLELPETEKAKRMLERIRDQVRGGAPLSDALEQNTACFRACT